jgi:hypothetical protein
MKMTKGQRVALFSLLIIVGLFFQLPLGMYCRCHWGVLSSKMIYGAMVVDAWVLIRLLIAAAHRQFLNQCLIGGAIVATSPVWIPIVFKVVLAVYLLPKGEPLHNLFH